MVCLLFFITWSLVSSQHHHAPHHPHFKHHRPHSIDLSKLDKSLDPIENININIYTPPVTLSPKKQHVHLDTPRPSLVDSRQSNNTKIKVAIIGFSATVLSSAITAIIMWRTCSCQ